jgi:hypothetical protein
LYQGVSFDLGLTSKNARKAVSIKVVQDEQVISKLDLFWFTNQFDWPNCIRKRMDELKLEQLVEISCDGTDNDSQFAQTFDVTNGSPYRVELKLIW